MTSVLVIDIGNTSISAGLYRGGRIVRSCRLAQKDSTPAGRAALLKKLLRWRSASGTVIASVVPRVNEEWAGAAFAAGGGPRRRLRRGYR